MRIGFDAKRLFHNETGLGQYARTLLKDFVNFNPDQENILFSPKINKSQYFSEFDAPNYKQADLGKWAALKRIIGYREFINRLKIDVFHGLSNELPHNIHQLKTPSVVTIHDVIFKVLPDTYSSFDRAIYNYKTKFACKHADVIVSISENTKRDLVKYYHVDVNKIKVIYQTCHDRFKMENDSFVKPKIASKLPKEYFIQVGSINHRKNLLNTLKALADIAADERPHLVVVGRGSGNYYNSVLEFIAEYKMSDTVHIYENIADDELPYLYSQAICSLYISNYEGFGIPIIESLFCGTPVITSETSSMPEAVGPCGTLVDPQDVDSIKDAILNPPQFSSELSNDFLERFSSKTIINQWKTLYQSLVNKGQ